MGLYLNTNMSAEMSIFSKIWARRVAESGPGGFDCRFGATGLDSKDLEEFERNRVNKVDDEIRRAINRALRSALK